MRIRGCDVYGSCSNFPENKIVVDRAEYDGDGYE